MVERSLEVLKTGISRQNVGTLASLNTIMYNLRDLRKQMALKILASQPLCEEEYVSYGNVLESLEDGLSEQYSRCLTADASSFHINIKDEVLGCRKDIAYLQFLQSKIDFSEFVNVLAETSHPGSKKEFYDELKELLPFMKGLCKTGIDLFITDWDGTMKNYCSSYGTSMQPLYSAVLLALFVQRYTKFSAVLTAGPLRGPGILDLVCIPLSGYLTFGGSWGQEWFINGEHWINDSFLSEKSKIALESLEQSLEAELFGNDNYSFFKLIGSGYQKKVDRVNIGFQNISKDVSEAMIEEFLEKIQVLVAKADPDATFFVIQKSHYDIEIVLKPTDEAHKSFNKADGVEQCLRHLNLSLKDGTVLVCGDTASDVPMVEHSLHANPERTYTVFVNTDQPVKQRLEQLFPSAMEKYRFVGCTEVVHVAMACIVFDKTLDHLNCD